MFCPKAFCCEKLPSNFSGLLLALTLEYHATMESYSDKFHIDIPNVV
jgi:hypothetical protein